MKVKFRWDSNSVFVSATNGLDLDTLIVGAVSVNNEYYLQKQLFLESSAGARMQ